MRGFNLFFTFLFVTFSFSQENNEVFKGEIIFNVSSKILNPVLFDDNLKSVIKKADSILKLKKSYDPLWHQSNIATLNLILDPRQKGIINLDYTYKFNDTVVSYSYMDKNKIFEVNIDRESLQSRKFDRSTNKLIEYDRYTPYNNTLKYKEIIYKDSIKNIFGFECYKVVVIENDETQLIDGVTMQDIDPSSKLIKEMYVTDEIKSLIYPLRIRKELLKKYYPLEIKIYSSLFKNRITLCRVDHLVSE